MAIVASDLGNFSVITAVNTVNTYQLCLDVTCVHMLWFNFLGLNSFSFLLKQLIIIHYQTP